MPARHERTTTKQRLKGKLYPLNMRTSYELRRQLEAAAAKSGRSLTREVEERLQQSFLPPPGLEFYEGATAETLSHLARELGRQGDLLAKIAEKIGLPSTVESDAPRVGLSSVVGFGTVKLGATVGSEKSEAPETGSK